MIKLLHRVMAASKGETETTGVRRTIQKASGVRTGVWKCKEWKGRKTTRAGRRELGAGRCYGKHKEGVDDRKRLPLPILRAGTLGQRVGYE
eukprot:760353-Hanusia_phi.AAC.6